MASLSETVSTALTRPSFKQCDSAARHDLRGGISNCALMMAFLDFGKQLRAKMIPLHIGGKILMLIRQFKEFE